MVTARDVIFISSIEWEFLWQVHQEIATCFANAGNRVLFVENTGVRAPGARDAVRIRRRVQHWTAARPTSGVRQVASNIFVLSPIVLPPFGNLVRRLTNRELFLRPIKRIVERLHIRDPLIWTFLPTDTALDLIGMLAAPASKVVYYCGADFSLLSSRPDRCRYTENQLLTNADIVFATCSELVERCRAVSNNVHEVPALVNLDAFPLTRRLNNGHGSRGEDLLSRLPRPIVGYVGGLHKFCDYRLLIEMARARPGWSWVFVGDGATNVEELRKLANTHFPGLRPHSEVADYIRAFDVCLVPYIANRLTATVVPLKVNEYLAMGKPVVSSELPAVREFNQRHRILITARDECGPFLKSIEDALASPLDDAIIQRRRAVAALGDSKLFFDRISTLIEAL